jgi:hypothetical protein
MCSSNPLQGTHCTTVTASHLTQGRVEFESVCPCSTDKGLDLWEASIVLVLVAVILVQSLHSV